MDKTQRVLKGCESWDSLVSRLNATKKRESDASIESASKARPIRFSMIQAHACHGAEIVCFQIWGD